MKADHAIQWIKMPTHVLCREQFLSAIKRKHHYVEDEDEWEQRIEHDTMVLDTQIFDDH